MGDAAAVLCDVGRDLLGLVVDRQHDAKQFGLL